MLIIQPTFPFICRRSRPSPPTHSFPHSSAREDHSALFLSSISAPLSRIGRSSVSPTVSISSRSSQRSIPKRTQARYHLRNRNRNRHSPSPHPSIVASVSIAEGQDHVRGRGREQKQEAGVRETPMPVPMSGGTMFEHAPPAPEWSHAVRRDE
jgi:hypothetical protein